MLLKNKFVVILIIIFVLTNLCDCRKLKKKSSTTKLKVKSNNYNNKVKYHKTPAINQKNPKQMIYYQTRETNQPNFIRLVVMRLIYGIASQMGIEDRLAGFFAPPNVEEDDDFLGGLAGGLRDNLGDDFDLGGFF